MAHFLVLGPKPTAFSLGGLRSRQTAHMMKKDRKRD